MGNSCPCWGRKEPYLKLLKPKRKRKRVPKYYQSKCYICNRKKYGKMNSIVTGEQKFICLDCCLDSDFTAII